MIFESVRQAFVKGKQSQTTTKSVQLQKLITETGSETYLMLKHFCKAFFFYAKMLCCEIKTCENGNPIMLLMFVCGSHQQICLVFSKVMRPLTECCVKTVVL